MKAPVPSMVGIRGHGVTFATGTPISNSMVEMYTMPAVSWTPRELAETAGLGALRRLGRHVRRGHRHNGDFAGNGAVAPAPAAVSPAFTNLPELQQMFLSFADVADGGDARPAPPEARRRPNRWSSPARCPRSNDRCRSKLVERYERIRSQKIDPRVDNALAITTGRPASWRSMRGCSLLRQPDFPESKVEMRSRRRMWRPCGRGRLPRAGRRWCSATWGVHPTPWGYSAYDQVNHEARRATGHSPRADRGDGGCGYGRQRKQSLFEKVRNGAGPRASRPARRKMGTGTKRAESVWLGAPSSRRPRGSRAEGRATRGGGILRQGNENEQVSIYRYRDGGDRSTPTCGRRFGKPRRASLPKS